MERDFAGIDDMLPSLGEVTGRRALVECLARRLQTRHGSYWRDRDFGHDIRQYLNSPMTSLQRASHRIATECEKDERVQSATVTLNMAGDVLTIRCAIRDAAGPFTFTLEIDAVSSRLLYGP